MSYFPSTSLKTSICYVIKHFFKVIRSNKYPCNLFPSQVEQTQAMVYFLYRISIRIFLFPYQLFLTDFLYILLSN